MGPGRLSAWLRAPLCAALVAGATVAAAHAAPQTAKGWGLPQLMHELGQVRSETAKFTERKTMHMLKTPIETSGRLHYVAPDHLRKITLSPHRQRFILDGRKVTITGGKKHRTRHFSLGDDKRIEGLVEGIRATLAGDLHTLKKFYNVTLSGDNAQWQLTLRPKGRKLAQFISSMHIDGSGNRIEAIDTKSGNGDHSEMSIVEASINAR